MAEKINIATIEIDVNDFIVEAKKAKDEINRLVQANKDLKASGKASTETIVENEIALKTARQAYNQNINSAKALQIATKELATTIDTEGKSVQQLIQDRNKLIGLSKNIKGVSDEEIALRKKLNTAIDTQTEVIRKNQSAYSGSKDMIGEYKQALSTLSPSLGSVLNTVTQLKDAFLKQKDIIKNNIEITKAKIAQDKAQAATQGIVKSGIISINGALKLFKIALASTGIGLLIVALGSLVTYLTTTQKGIDAINSVLTHLKVILATVLGLVQKLGGAIVDVFKGKSNFITEFGNAVKTNLIEKFSALGKIIKGIFTLNNDLITEGIEQSKKAGEEYRKVVDKNGNALKKELDDALIRSKRIAALDIEISKGKNQLILDESELAKKIKANNKIAEDTTKTIKEREEAARASVKNSEDLLKLQQDLNAKEIEKAVLNSQNNDTSREQQMVINELKAKQNDLETAQLELQTTQTNKLNTIRREGEAKALKASSDAFNLTQQQLSEELELFLTQQGTKAKTLLEDVAIAQEVSNKRKAILDNELLNGKISKTKYATEILKIDQELNNKQAELAIELAFNTMESERFQIEQTIKNQQEKNNALLEIEKEFLDARLLQGVISQTEYNNAINLLNEENRISNAELEAERNAIDAENKLANEQLSFSEAQQRRRDELEERKQLELTESERLGASKDLIEKKYSKLSFDLDAKLLKNKLILAETTLNRLSEALGKQGKSVKAISEAISLINVFQGITAELSTKANSPFDFAIKLANIATLTAVGFKAVKNIKSTVVPKAERGAVIGGLPHAQGGTLIEAERGEAIINKNSTSRFKPLLSAVNQIGGGVSFGATSQTQNDIFNYDAMGKQFENAISKMPPPIVSVEEINDVSKKYTKVVQDANI